MKSLRLTDLPLVVKMGFAPALAIVMLATVTLVMLAAQSEETRALTTVAQTEMPAALQLADINARVSNAHGQMYLLLTHQAGSIDADQIPGEITALKADIGGIQKDVSAMEKTVPPSEKAAFTTLSKDLKDYESAVDVVGSMMAADFSTAAGFVAPFEDLHGKITKTLNKVVDSNKARSMASAKASVAKAQATGQLVMIGALITLLGVGLIAVMSVLGVRKAIAHIAKATETLAKGDNTINLDALMRQDELGAIVRSLTVFRDNQVRLAGMRDEQEALEGQQSAMRREQETQREEIRMQQQLVVGSLASGLERLSAGNLTYRIAEPFAGEYEKLRADFNAAMEQLQDTIQVIADNTQGIHSGTGEISQAADDLSRRTEQQAASLEETAAALDEITATVRKTSEGANHAREVVSSAKKDAEKGGLVVGQAVAAMTQIEQSARQISQIIGVIDEIAFQTNLLALNAGVEAARAGDAGKGFAVVASEVRALAQRSADAAKQIKQLIANSSTEVEAGVKLVGQTGEALERLVSQISHIDKAVAQIAASAGEQSQGLAQVNVAVNQMDQVTQQNAAMVEEAAAASHGLAQEAETLATLLGRFDLGAPARAAPKPRRHAA